MRRRILTPDVSETSLDKRGFHKKSPAAQELLETVGKVFLDGYGHAVEARFPADAAARIDEIPPRFRGFAWEGAGMGLGMLDGLPGGGREHVDDVLDGPGAPHLYLIYVGVGWAMARLPRLRWPSPDGFDPLLRWLLLDGYGFHQAYFKTAKYIDRQYQDPAFSWPSRTESAYANRAIDQGIGRALWFIGGTDADLVTTMIGRFEPSRHGDLYAGVGLAATYAGGVESNELELLAARAGVHRGQLAQGSAFAAEARISAGLHVPHTELATNVLCGLDAALAAKITQDLRPDNPVDGALPAFETWRRRIAEEVLSLGGVGK